jgi:hypothetical protein
MGIKINLNELIGVAVGVLVAVGVWVAVGVLVAVGGSALPVMLITEAWS